MRPYLWLLAAAGLAACGDDGTSGAGAGGAAGGVTTGDATTTDVTSGAQTTTGAGGEGGQAPKAPNGVPCTEADACEGGICLREDLTGYPGGMCVSPCDTGDAASCNGICVEHGLFGDICKLDCLGDLSVCRDAYACQGAPDAGYTCVPACTDVADCVVTGFCEYGSCLDPNGEPETDCENSIDDDGDMDVDCADDDCQGTAACPPIPEICDNAQDDDYDDDPDCADDECAAPCAALELELCAAAPILAASQSASTAPGPGIGGSGCLSQSQGTVSPQIFRYQAPSDGTLKLTLQSVFPQVIEIVNACDLNGSSYVGCQGDYDVDGFIEMQRSVVAGAEYTVLIFAAAPGHEDAFTLTSELQ